MGALMFWGVAGFLFLSIALNLSEQVFCLGLGTIAGFCFIDKVYR